MKIIQRDETISVNELKEMSTKMFHQLVKAVVDIELEIVAVDAEMHVDLEQFLLENDDHPSQQNDLWGINFHPDKLSGPDFVEFDSLINIRQL